MNQPKLVCVSPHVPFEGIDHAGGDYLLEYLTAVHSAGWSVTLVSPSSRANLLGLENAPSWLDVVLTTDDSRQSLLRRSVRLLTRGVSADPPRVWYRRLDARARKELDTATVIDLQWMSCIQYAPMLRRRHPGIPIVATPHDVKSESFARARRSPQIHIALMSILALPAIRRTEDSAITACSRVFVFKPEDVAYFERRGTSAVVRTTPPLVRWPAGAPQADPSSSLLVFPAAFWRDENDEAARWFLTKAWPLIADRLPQARVRFAGAGPSRWLEDHRNDRVEVTGYMDDLMDAYRGAAAVVAPMQRGAGLKFKVAQAVAMGFPVIGTSVAIEGINGLTSRPTLQAFDGPDAFADEVVATLSQIDGRIAQARTEARAVRDALDFDVRIRRQVDDYGGLSPSTPR